MFVIRSSVSGLCNCSNGIMCLMNSNKKDVIKKKDEARQKFDQLLPDKDLGA